MPVLWFPHLKHTGHPAGSAATLDLRVIGSSPALGIELTSNKQTNNALEEKKHPNGAERAEEQFNGPEQLKL